MKYLNLLIILIILQISIVFCVTNVKVTQYPETMKQDFNQKFSYSIANFGRIPYGEIITYPLKLADPIEGCEPLNPPSDIAHTKMGAPIYLIERGSCAFTDKALNAQQAGAKAVFIIDTYEEDVEKIILGDNGIGDAVKIPTILIGREEGEKLLQALDIQRESEDFEEILIEIDYNFYQKIKEPYVELYLNTPEQRNQLFLSSFLKKIEKHNLERDFNINPIFQIYTDNFSQDNENCINNEDPNYKDFEINYCAMDLDGYSQGTGSDMVEEYLIQSCIIDNLGFDFWSQYIKIQQQRCFQIAGYKYCRNDILYTLNLDIEEELSDCLQFSESNRNQILDKQIDNISENEIMYFPSITINNMKYFGAILSKNVIEAICSASTHEKCIKIIELAQKEHDAESQKRYIDFLVEHDLY